MKVSNWPGNVDYGSPNYTLRFDRVSRYDGVGHWAKDSSRIPKSAWVGAAALVAGFIGLFSYIGAAAGLT